MTLLSLSLSRLLFESKETAITALPAACKKTSAGEHLKGIRIFTVERKQRQQISIEKNRIRAVVGNKQAASFV